MTHLLLALLALPLTASCLLPNEPEVAGARAAAAARDSVPRHNPFDFAAATGDLELGEGEVRVADLVTAYGDLTGQVLVLTPSVRERAASLPIPALRASATGVQATVEQLLALHGLGLALQPGAAPRTVVVEDCRQPLGPAPFVPLERLRSSGHHPAVRVATTLLLEHNDPRMVASSLRLILPDPSVQLLPTGMRSLLLTGPASSVLALADLLESVDAPGAPGPSVVQANSESGAAEGTPAPAARESKPSVPSLTVLVLPLRHCPAQELVEVLFPVLECVARADLPGFQGRACQLSVDERLNALVLALPESKVAMAQELVEALDQPAREDR